MLCFGLILKVWKTQMREDIWTNTGTKIISNLRIIFYQRAMVYDIENYRVLYQRLLKKLASKNAICTRRRNTPYVSHNQILYTSSLSCYKIQSYQHPISNFPDSTVTTKLVQVIQWESHVQCTSRKITGNNITYSAKIHWERFPPCNQCHTSVTVFL